MKSFIEIAKQRYSSRKYQGCEVEKEKILTILEAARVAPSAVNKQPWHFVVITEKQRLNEIYDCYSRDWLRTAPVIIVACGDHLVGWRRADGKDHVDIDMAIAVDHMTLAATDLGLATCWICKFDVMRVASVLKLPSNIEPVAMLALGYPADSAENDRHSTKRKKLDEIVHWDVFSYDKIKP